MTVTPADRLAEFMRQWASGAVAERHGHHFIALMRFLEAANQAPTWADETSALTRAFACYEVCNGKYDPSLGDVPVKSLGPDAHLGASEDNESGYGHGV